MLSLDPPKPPENEVIARRAEARSRARDAAALVIDEAGRIAADARESFWDELKKMLPLPAARMQTRTPNPADEPLTDRQSRIYGRTKIPFGKYEGQCVDEVPLAYLEKLCDPQPFIRMLRRYLAGRRILLEDENGNLEDAF